MKKVVFLITFLLCGVFAYAQTSTENIGGLLYSIDTEAKTATLIANEDDEYKGDIFIPEKVKAKNGATYTVVALGEKCFENCGIKSVIIPSTVKSIGDECFKSCYNLKEIAIPSSVAKLGKDSFSWCDNLEKVSLPQSVTYLSDGCFQFCRKLNDITIPGSVTSLGTDCFEGCEGLTEVEIPASVKSLPEYCFTYCRNLNKIVFPSTLTTLDEYSLYQCESLESLFFKGKVPEGLKEIQVPRTCWLYVSQEYYSEFQNTLKSIFPYIFTWNPNGQTQDVSVWSENIDGVRFLVDSQNGEARVVENKRYSYKGSLVIPEKIIARDGKNYSVVALDDNSFFGSSSLLSVKIPTSVTRLGNSCFENSYDLQKVEIPSTVVSLGERCFYDCSDLVDVEIPSGITSLSKYCFYRCESLTSVNIPSSVTSIGDYCFDDCEGLTNINIPSSVTSLGCDCFYGCKNISSFVIPASVAFIGDWCFSECDNLETMVFKGGLPKNVKDCYAPNVCVLLVPSAELEKYEKTLKDTYPYIYAYDVTGVEDAAVPAWLETIQGLRYLVDCNAHAAIVMPSKDKKYFGDIIVPANIMAKDGQKYPVTALGDESFSGCNNLKNIIIPQTVTSLGKNCFNSCTNLTSIEIPSSVTSLGEGCFYLTGLKSVKIPSSITSLSTDCFQFCSSLESVEIPSSVTSFGEYCFYGCSKLESIDIPSSVTSLGIGCFMQCSYLEKVVIPSSITSLSTNCFWGCSGLKNIEIPSSVTLLAGGCFLGCSSLESIIIPSSVEEMGGLIFWQCNLLKSVYFKGKLPKYLTTYCNAPTDCSFYVPRPYLQEYIDAIGSKYSSIYPWDGGVVIVRAKSYSRVYGDENPVFELDLGGSSLEGVPELLCTANATSQVGTYTIEVRKGTIKNEDVLFENGSLTITKAPLTISVGNYTKKQGDAMPTFKASYTGFKNGEDESVLIKQPVFETTATAESAPGEYPITVYGVEADNYEVKSYIAGTLTVEEGVTDISHIEQLCDKAAWYTLQGVKLSDKPSMPGVYIHQGRKVIVR